jgi:peptidyl-prolyl cis-trans isomerase B (cyclophilin B)
MIAAPAHRFAALSLVALLALAACGGGSTAAPIMPSGGPTQAPSAAPASPPAAGIPADCPTTPPPPLAADDTATVTLATEEGDIVIEVKGSLAPNAAGNFVALAECGFFDGVIFHRLVPGFVIQGGDPLSKDADPSNDGFGGNQMEAEPRKLSNLRGTVSMASSSRMQPIDSQSDMQFFINLEDKCARLDVMGFIPFGKVVAGMDVVDKIAKQPRDQRDRPLKNVTIKSITIKTK